MNAVRIKTSDKKTSVVVIAFMSQHTKWKLSILLKRLTIATGKERHVDELKDPNDKYYEKYSIAVNKIFCFVLVAVGSLSCSCTDLWNHQSQRQRGYYSCTAKNNCQFNIFWSV